MKIVLLLAALGLVPMEETEKQKDILLAATCFFQYEERSGTNKICYYNCLGNKTAITISSLKLCPLNIDR